MKKSIIAIVVAATAFVSVSSFATGTSSIGAVTMGSKAQAINAARQEANNSVQSMKDNLSKYNDDRANYTSADGDAYSNAFNTVKEAGAKIAGIQAQAVNATENHNPAGNPTGQIGAATHLDGNVTDAARNTAMQAAINAYNQGQMAVQANQARTQQQVTAAAQAAEAAAHQARYNMTTQPAQAVTAATDSINVAVSSLKPETAVSVTINGVTQTTTAAVIASVDPTVQVAVPHVAAIISSPTIKGGSNNDHGHSSHVQGDNNGGSNAHSSAMGGRGQAGQRSGKSAANNF